MTSCCGTHCCCAACNLQLLHATTPSNSDVGWWGSVCCATGNFTNLHGWVWDMPGAVGDGVGAAVTFSGAQELWDAAQCQARVQLWPAVYIYTQAGVGVMREGGQPVLAVDTGAGPRQGVPGFAPQ